jgi:hypothetical protein
MRAVDTKTPPFLGFINAMTPTPFRRLSPKGNENRRELAQTLCGYRIKAKRGFGECSPQKTLRYLAQTLARGVSAPKKMGDCQTVVGVRNVTWVLSVLVARLAVR